MTNISYIIPHYNHENYIVNAIDSIFNDNFIDGDELIIIDDGSTNSVNGTLEGIINIYNNVFLYRNKSNKGPSFSRNFGISKAKNDYIFNLDADNILADDSIKNMRIAIDDGYDIIALQQMQYFKDNKLDISENTVVYTLGEFNFRDILAGKRNPLASGNYLFSKESWEKCGKYDENIKLLETWDFGFRQIAEGFKAKIVEGHYWHRIGTNSFYNREHGKLNMSEVLLPTVLKYEHLLDPSDVLYLKTEGKNIWWSNLRFKPLKALNEDIGNDGFLVFGSSNKNFGTIDKWR